MTGRIEAPDGRMLFWRKFGEKKIHCGSRLCVGKTDNFQVLVALPDEEETPKNFDIFATRVWDTNGLAYQISYGESGNVYPGERLILQNLALVGG